MFERPDGRVARREILKQGSDCALMVRIRREMKQEHARNVVEVKRGQGHECDAGN